MGRSDISYQPGAAPLAQLNLPSALNLPGAPVAQDLVFSGMQDTNPQTPATCAPHVCVRIKTLVCLLFSD